MRFGVLGPLAAWTTDGEQVRIPDRKVRALLADLLVHEGRPVPASRLIDDLWGEELPVNPMSTLQTRVSQLRRALEEAEKGSRQLVVTQAPGYLLACGSDDLDVGRFRALVSEARRSSVARTRAALLADALTLWRGAAYADVSEASFARAAIIRLDEERLTVLEEHAEALLELGEHDTLAAPLGALVLQHPLRQRLRAAYMLALYRAGRHDEALATYHDLRIRLDGELGLDPGAELDRLYLAILNQDPALTPPAAAGAPPSNLPAALPELIGRATAVGQIGEHLRRNRLVTLTGPGGVGKTSVALQVARQFAGEYDHGAWLVDLTGVPHTRDAEHGEGKQSEVAAVAAAVADVLESPPGESPPGESPPGQGLADRLRDGRLRDGRLLLVLDNCEHVVESAAVVAGRLLRQAPRLHVLATSREPLGVAGEHLWPVLPLDLPDPGADPRTARQAGAVRLFSARAAAAAPDFQITQDNVGDIVEICRRLDGLPLALELAATRVRGLGVRDLAARLDDSFRLLAARQPGRPDRHQTLRAVIEWSWDLLSEPERAVLRRLAMHGDGCTLLAAEVVCAGDPVADGGIAELLARLVDRSLVVRLEGTAGSRYRLPETIRAYGLQRLDEAGETAVTRDRYVAYFDGLAQRSEPRLYGHAELFRYLGGLHQEPSPAARVAASPSPARTVTSRDGTPIAFRRWGHGPPLILLGGPLHSLETFVPLAQRLAPRFGVVAYDRRGRGGSGDTPPFAVAREVEDLAAVVERTGGSAVACAVSSGAVLAAEAVAQGTPLTALVLIEPPFILDHLRPPMPRDFIARLDELVAAGRRGDAVELFLTVAVEMPAEIVTPMRGAPMWPGLEAVAHTIAYDLAIMGDFSLPARWADAVTVPTLVIDGGPSAGWRKHAAQAVADLLPDGRRHTMEGQPHDVDPDVLAPILEGFFLDHADRDHAG
jgi:predicted ATPase/DNA-binding SARP family transcriptional activator